MTSKRSSSAAVMTLLALGCSKPSPATDSTPITTTTASAPAAPSSSAHTTAATMMSVTDTPADHLGTLAPNTGIPVGQKVPDVHARDLDGKDVTLSSLYEKGPVLLVFYRGGWCPFCNSEIHSLTTAYPEFQKRGVTPVAISVDEPEKEAKMKATYAIPFPVLSGSPAKVIEAFHVVNRVSDEQLATMKDKYGIDLEGASGQKHHEIAIPAFFLVDRKGVVRWAHSDTDFKTRPSTAQLLSAIDGVKLPSP